MAKFYSPNKSYSGVTAGVTFINGCGSTENAHIAEWLKEHGYLEEAQTEAIPVEVPENMTDTVAPEEVETGKKTGKKAGE